ncbi:hypothetical protein TVAG_317220 [Trichomonas vaginalis G3]|uniref:Uncharacterized protein n=1 Tax=Trichomonas vaginalis (strain ATCC PRA-98 / G3) TaxID=412133 RepID=A2FQZ7_TRIV3|nr:hypothetical protein TVAG_317220 [Trichomonas vaginalis G3]|eukprot:XP_001305594.1 hypothetical protein [Trichomonas vaginalis G3]
MSNIAVYRCKSGRKCTREVTKKVNDNIQRKIEYYGDRFTEIKRIYGDLTGETLKSFAFKMLREFNIKSKFYDRRSKDGLLVWICENYESLSPHLDILLKTNSSQEVEAITQTNRGDENYYETSYVEDNIDVNFDQWYLF